MRPIYLEISGFGAYSKKQIVDFTNLNSNIFVITGPTGAGKTTIFDAISYALYGTASGSSREGKSCRSDYADNDTDTYVKLIFEAKGKTYTIRRNPEYYRKKAKGEGEKKVADKVELVMPDNSVLTRKTEVAESIKDILGIDKDQFKQIVMLPQGEFKKMLESSSDEKEKIFRRVFNTDRFNKLQEYFYNKTNAMYVEIKSMLEQKSAYINTIECDEASDLSVLLSNENKDSNYIIIKTKELINEDTKKAEAIKQNEDKKKSEIVAFTEKKTKSIEINKMFEEKAKKEKEKIELEEKKDIIKKLEQDIDRAKSANKVKIVDDKLIEKKRNKDKEENECKDINNRVISLSDSLKINEAKLKEENDKEEEREKISNYINDLNNYTEKIKGYEKRKEDLNKIKLLIEEEKKRFEEGKKHIEELKKKSDCYEADLIKINKIKIEIKDKRLEYSRLSQIKNNLADYIDKLNQRIKLNSKHIEESNKYNEKDKEAKRKKQQYDDADEQFRREQAGILAINLKEGSKCPVCGSTHHPELAKLADNTHTEDDIKKLKEISEKAIEEKNNQYNLVQSLFSDMKNIDNNLQEIKSKLLEQDDSYDSIFKDATSKSAHVLMKDIERKLSTIENEGKKMSGQINLEEATNKILQESKLEIESIQKINEELTTKITTDSKLESQYDTEVKSIEKEIPQEIRTEALLINKIKIATEKLEAMKKALASAQELCSKNKVDLASEQAKLKSKKLIIEDLSMEVVKLNGELSEALLKYGFSDYESYKNAILEEGTINKYDKDIRSYYEEVASTTRMYEDLVEKTKDLNIIDIQVIQDKISLLSEEQDKLNIEYNSIMNRVKNNKKSLSNVESIDNKISGKEEKYKVYSKISRAMNGYNDSKISFERFVLAAYFNDVLEAANVRLNKLTNGRFQLSRSEEVIDGRKRKEGLEMKVYDYYTGKSRPVGTLSGGEGFKASLALALGLSDVIQSYAGGVEMNTMFVDEGFGSLDDESLENAIDCLIDLQSGGRLVGIISHVQTLKDRIGTRIEVSKGNSGSELKLVID